MGFSPALQIIREADSILYTFLKAYICSTKLWYCKFVNCKQDPPGHLRNDFPCHSSDGNAYKAPIQVLRLGATLLLQSYKCLSDLKEQAVTTSLKFGFSNLVSCKAVLRGLEFCCFKYWASVRWKTDRLCTDQKCCSWGWQMAWLLKYQLCNHENPILTPRTPWERLPVIVWSCNPSAGGWGHTFTQLDPWGLGVSLPKLPLNSRPVPEDR